MDTWIDKVMVIRTRFMWDIEKKTTERRLSFVYDRYNNFLYGNARNSY